MKKSTFYMFVLFAIMLYFSEAILPLWFDQGKTINRTEVPIEGSTLQVLYYRAMYSLTVIIVLRHIQDLIRSVKLGWIAWIVLGYILISMAWALDSVESLRQWWGIILAFSFGVYLVSEFTPAKIIGLMTALFACIVITSWYFIIFRPDLAMHSDGSWRGAYEDRNDLGFYMNIAFVIFLVFWHIRKEPFVRYLFTLPLMISTLCFIFFSHSGTGIICFCAVSMGYILLAPLRSGPFIFLFVLPFLVVLGTTVFFYEASILELLGKDETLTGRTEVWTNALAVWAKQPILGYGAQNIYIRSQNEIFTTTFTSEDGIFARAPHNLYIAIFLKFGVLGSFLFICFFIKLFMTAINENRRNHTIMGGWYLLLLIVVMVYGLTLTIDNRSLIWIFYPIILYAPYNFKADAKEPDEDYLPA